MFRYKREKKQENAIFKNPASNNFWFIFDFGLLFFII